MFVYRVANRTHEVFFEDAETAQEYIGTFETAASGGGLEVEKIPVFPRGCIAKEGTGMRTEIEGGENAAD